MQYLKTKANNAVAVIPSSENQKGIEIHLKVAKHLQAAAKSHLQAAKQHKNGNHEKATQSTITAYGHLSLAKKAQEADVRHHAING